MTDKNKGCGCNENNLHEHDHDCDCGCEHDHDEMEVITLEMEDGTELDCYVLGVFEVETKQYIAIVPTDDDQAMLYEYKEDGESFELLDIESDEEYEKVALAFQEAIAE